MAKTRINIERSSGNVFTDLNLPNAEEKQTKVRLIVVINRIIEERGLTQAQAAKQLGINQPKVSALKSYKLGGFSVERLIRFATALEYDVVIELKPKPDTEPAAKIIVKAA